MVGGINDDGCYQGFSIIGTRYNSLNNCGRGFLRNAMHNERFLLGWDSNFHLHSMPFQFVFVVLCHGAVGLVLYFIEKMKPEGCE